MRGSESRLDMGYARDLGYCAAKYVLAGGSGAVISLRGGRFAPVSFASMVDAASGRTRTRLVDIGSTRYAIARRYIIRLRRDDFDDPHELAKLAATAGLSDAEFRRRFAYLVANEPPLEPRPNRAGVFSIVTGYTTRV